MTKYRKLLGDARSYLSTQSYILCTKIKSKDDDSDNNDDSLDTNDDEDSDDNKGDESEYNADKNERIEQELHDNPKGLIKVDVKGNRTVTFILSENFSVSYNNNTVSADVTDAKLIFRTHPVTAYKIQKMAEHQKHVAIGILDGSVGAEVDVEDDDSISTVINNCLYISIDQVENNTVSISVCSELTRGSTISLSISRDILQPVQAENVTILFDGQPIQMADGYDDIMNPDDDNGAAEYLVLLGAEGVEVLISIPHFSSHSVVISTGAAAQAATGQPRFEIGVGVKGILLVYLIYRCRI